MFPFRKKEKEELAVSKDIKTPRKPRKKKEPPKPWGKLERLIVFIIFVSIPIISIIFYSRSKNSAVKITSNVLGITSWASPKDVSKLQNSLENSINSLSNYGIWMETLNGNYKLGINENTQFDGASLFKLPLMIGYFEEIDKGHINPNTSYTLKYSDQAAGAGLLATLPPGTVVTYHDIVETMGKNSDNSAFQIITSVLGIKKETEVIHELGMTNTNFETDTTTAKDMGILLSKLINSNILSTSSKNELINSLKNTDFEDLIPAGIPSGIEVAHKYGSIDGQINDAAIVYAPSPYILVVLSNDPNQSQAQKEIQQISKIVYDWLN